jgi:hypothetical protein
MEVEPVVMEEQPVVMEVVLVLVAMAVDIELCIPVLQVLIVRNIYIGSEQL